jgi:TonB family protein
MNPSIQMTSKFHVGLLTTMAMSAGNVLAQSSPPYVPAQSIACQYGLPSDALQKLPTQHLTAAVRVSLDARGKVKDAVLAQSSGDAAFDALTVRQSRKAVCKPFSDVDGTSIPVVTIFIFPVTSAEFPPSAASESFAAKVARRIRPNIVWYGRISDLETTISVRCSQDGKLLSATIVQSSGNPEWDAVALSAVQRADPMPSGTDGTTPTNFNVTLRSGRG